MESGAKMWGVYTMATEETKLRCEKHGDQVVFRALGKIQVMGRQQAVPIYEIVGLKDRLEPTARECVGLFEQGLEKFYARDWDRAVSFFKQSVALEPNQPGRTPGVKENPSLVYVGLVEHYKIAPPPPDWDGRYVMTEK
jgi:adenylate cyclase